MKYFKMKEFSHSDTAVSLGIDNTIPKACVANIEHLAYNVLAPLREAWGLPIRVTSGYRCPELNEEVGGIIKSEEMLHYSGFTLGRVRGILAYVLPRFVPRTEVAMVTDAIIEELRMGREEPEAPKKVGRPKKQNTKQSTQNTKQANTETHEQEETGEHPR